MLVLVLGHASRCAPPLPGQCAPWPMGLVTRHR